MGKIVNNPITGSFSGKFGDDLVFRRLGDRTIFARKGENTKPASSAQTKVRQEFGGMQYHIRHLLRQPEVSERYAVMARLNNFRSAHTAAVKDYTSTPEIDSVIIKKYKGKRSNIITIKPQILLKIERMELKLYHADGTVFETGTAVKAELNWEYRASPSTLQISGLRVEVVAYDWFGKAGTFIQVIN
jgi:hypothetical protein